MLEDDVLWAAPQLRERLEDVLQQLPPDWYMYIHTLLIIAYALYMYTYSHTHIMYYVL